MWKFAIAFFLALLMLPDSPAPSKVKPRRLSCSGFERLSDGTLRPLDPIYFEGD
jgi:hypothetical protein